MRVIAGTARSLPLQTVEGLDTRPTTDRIKETLFNMIGPLVADARFLDLFSGSGGIGIEALSRGAKEAVFVEKNPRACSCIRRNLSFTKLDKRGRLLGMDVLQALVRLEGEEAFDLIFMDPPYGKGLERLALGKLSQSTLVGEDTMLIIEESLQADFSYVDELGFMVTRVKDYKTNKHVFLRKAKGTNPTSERRT